MTDVGAEPGAVGESAGGQKTRERDPDHGIEHQENVREGAAAIEQQRDRDDPRAHDHRPGGRRDRIEDPGPEGCRPVPPMLHQRAVW